MQCWARFVWGNDGLWPGPIEFNDARLLAHPIHIEFRRNNRAGLPINLLRNFIDEYSPVQVDASATSHKEVMDLLLIGCERAGIDIFAPDKEISLGHAVSEQIMLTISLPSEVTLTYLTDTLNPRINEVLDLGPDSILLISKRKGDLAYVMDRLPTKLRNSFSWWLAPDEGVIVPLSDDRQISGWVLDGARLLGE